MIPYKLFERLIADLIEFRTDPCDGTDEQLFETEELVDWPWNANSVQLRDWEDACDRTRVEFEAKVAEIEETES